MAASKRDFLQEEFNIGTGRQMRQSELITKLAEALIILLNLPDMLPEDYKRISELLKAADLYKESVKQIAQRDGRI